MKLLLNFIIELDEKDMDDYKSRYPDYFISGLTPAATLIEEALDYWREEGQLKGFMVNASGEEGISA